MKPYKGYSGTLVFDEDDMVFHGQLIGIDDIVSYEATTAEDLVRAFHDSVDDYLDLCAEEGRTPQKPYSGKLALRASPELHRGIAAAAAANATSINQWIVDVLAERVAQRPSGATKISDGH